MALPTTYSTGTASINANETAVTGQGTTWLTSGLQAGDLFWAAGLSARILSVNGNTSLTLAFPWPAASRTAAAYEVRFTPEATRVLGSTREVLGYLTNGLLSAFAALNGAANKLAYFTGAGTMALTDLTAHARALLGLSGGAGKFPRSTGANTIVMQDIVGAVAQASGIPTGAIVERGSNANGEYVRFADGTQICTISGFVVSSIAAPSGSIYVSGDYTWTYPAAFAVLPPGRGGSAVTSHARAWVTLGTSANEETTVMRFGAAAPFASNNPGNYQLFAIGRWF